MNDKRINIITGHYGSGKTNIAVNMALNLKKRGLKVCLVDFDIVNPYFRSADMRGILEEKGIKVLASVYANSNLDIPAIPSNINMIFDDKSYTVIMDVGGDDAGAAALGQFSQHIIEENNYAHYYVINAKRSMTQTAQEAVEIMREIEQISHLKVNYIINNTHLGNETNVDIITSSFDFANEVCGLSGLPLAFTAVKSELAKELHKKLDNDKIRIFPVEIYVKAPWENE
jgi:hypothetical protein